MIHNYKARIKIMNRTAKLLQSNAYTAVDGKVKADHSWFKTEKLQILNTKMEGENDLMNRNG